MAIKLTKKASSITVGLAFADASVRQIGVSEFADNDLLSNTEVRGILPSLSTYV